MRALIPIKRGQQKETISCGVRACRIRGGEANTSVGTRVLMNSHCLASAI
jgi:hypothetical protein